MKYYLDISCFDFKLYSYLVNLRFQLEKNDLLEELKFVYAFISFS